jgi:hypothetical protein
MLERDFKQEKDQRLAKDPQRVIAPERGAGSQELPRAFCPRLERAATRVEANLVQIAETVSSAEKNDEVRFSQGGGFPEVVRWLDSRLDTFFLVRCRAKPTGRVFPLPTSDLAFKVTFPEEPLKHCAVSVWFVFHLTLSTGRACTVMRRHRPFK